MKLIRLRRALGRGRHRRVRYRLARPLPCAPLHQTTSDYSRCSMIHRAPPHIFDAPRASPHLRVQRSAPGRQAIPAVEQLSSLLSARTQTRQPFVHSRQLRPTSLGQAPAEETEELCFGCLARSAATDGPPTRAAITTAERNVRELCMTPSSYYRAA
jgi:hypothetical protein